MSKNNNETKIEDILNYKMLYYDLKKKYDKMALELEELKIDLKIKEDELNSLKNKLDDPTNNLKIDCFQNNKSSDIYCKYNSKKNMDNYSIDSSRIDAEQDQELLHELIKGDLDEINNNSSKKIVKERFEIQLLAAKNNNNEANNSNNGSRKLSITKNNKINKSLTGDIDAILQNIKKKQESLHQTQKMFNLNNNIEK